MSLDQTLTNITTELIKFQSLPTDTKSCRLCLEWIADYLSGSDLKIEWFENEESPTLLITGKRTDKIDVLFHGHIDIVAGKEEQFVPKIVGDKIIGRGSMDMKGGIAALIVLAQNHFTDKSCAVLLTSDEEIGGFNGTGYVVNQKNIECNYCITAEPTDLIVGVEEKGVIKMKATLIGKPTHGSTPWEGDNPLYKLDKFFEYLLKTFPASKQNNWMTTVTPTIVHSENSQNQVPGEVHINLDCRFIPADDPQTIINKVSESADKLEVVTIEPPLKQLPHKYTDQLIQLSGTDAIKKNYATDARFFTENGIPAVIFGPTGEDIHGNEEWVSIKGLVDYYAILEKFLAKLK